jgi:hypothetical protein
MKNKKVGLVSLSLWLVIIAFIWSWNIFGICVGDHILTTLNIPIWSNMSSASGIHYTIYYAFIFLILALILGLKYRDNLFSKVGTILSIIFIAILVLGLFFVAI